VAPVQNQEATPDEVATVAVEPEIQPDVQLVVTDQEGHHMDAKSEGTQGGGALQEENVILKKKVKGLEILVTNLTAAVTDLKDEIRQLREQQAKPKPTQMSLSQDFVRQLRQLLDSVSV
jgi:hypothetical protein